MYNEVNKNMPPFAAQGGFAMILTEKNGYDGVFRFRMKDGELIFVSEGSNRFMYTDVEDGDRFSVKTES